MAPTGGWPACRISARPTRRSSTSAQWGLVEVAQLCQLQGQDLGDLGHGGAVFHEYLGDFTRYLDLQLDGWDGREGQAEVLCGVQKWRDAVQLEIPGREFQRRHLSQHQPPLGRSGRHRAVGSGRRDMRRARRQPQTARLRQDRGHQTILYLLPQDDRHRRPTRTRRSSPSISAIARRRSARLRGEWRAWSARRARFSRTPRFVAPAAHDGGVAPARAAPDRVLALVLRRPRRALRGQGVSCANTTSAIPGRPG